MRLILLMTASFLISHAAPIGFSADRLTRARFSAASVPMDPIEQAFPAIFVGLFVGKIPIKNQTGFKIDAQRRVRAWIGPGSGVIERNLGVVQQRLLHVNSTVAWRRSAQR